LNFIYYSGAHTADRALPAPVANAKKRGKNVQARAQLDFRNGFRGLNRGIGYAAFELAVDRIADAFFRHKRAG